MRKVTYLLAAFALATSAATMTSCVKDSESATVEVVRASKAKQLEALAAMQKAQGDAELIRASAEKLLIESQVKVNEAEAACKLAQAELLKAETAYKESQTEGNKIANEQAKVALERAQLELSKIKATIEANIATLIAQAEISKLKAEHELQQLIETYKLFDAEQTNKYLNKVIYLYSQEIAHQNILTTNLITAKHTLALNKSNWGQGVLGLEQLEIMKENEIADNTIEISINKKAIDALKAIPLGDMAAMSAQLEQAGIDKVKYNAEYSKVYSDYLISESKANKSINKWGANNYKIAIFYMSGNVIPVPYLRYTPSDVHGSQGTWYNEYKQLANTEYIATGWLSDTKILMNGSVYGPYYSAGLLTENVYDPTTGTVNLVPRYRNVTVDIPAYEYAVSQMQKEYNSYVATKNSRKVKIDEAKTLEAAELEKLKLFISQNNIDVQFLKWKNLNTDQKAKLDKYEVEQTKLSDIYISTRAELEKTRVDAYTKYTNGEITWVECIGIINKASEKMEATIKTQEDIVTAAYESYRVAFNLLDAENDLLNGRFTDKPGYIKSYFTSLDKMNEAVLSYYEAVGWGRGAEAQYNDHKSRLDVLKNDEAKAAYEELLKSALEDNKAYQIMEFENHVARMNANMSSTWHQMMFTIYSGYEQVEAKIAVLELYIKQLEQANVDVSLIENKEALIAYSEKQIELIEIEIKVCQDLVSKYKAMVDEEMAKK